MLEADIMRATGESVSRWGFVGFVGIRRLMCDGGGECTVGLRAGGVCIGGAYWVSFVSDGSGGEWLVGGGAIGNLKLEENEPEGFRPVVGRAGVLGAVMTPGLRLDGRAAKAKSLEGSWMVGGNEAPPASGEGCVAERKPGEETTAPLVGGRQHIVCAAPYLDTTRVGWA